MNKFICFLILASMGLTGCQKEEGSPRFVDINDLAVQFRIGSPGQNLCLGNSATINVTGRDLYSVPILGVAGKTNDHVNRYSTFTTESGVQSNYRQCTDFIYHVVSTYVDATANNGTGEVKDSIEVGEVDANCRINLTVPGHYYGFKVYAIAKYSPTAKSASTSVLCAP